MRRAALLCLLVACGSPARSIENATQSASESAPGSCLPPAREDLLTSCTFRVAANERLSRAMSPYDEVNQVRDYSFMVTNTAGFANAQCLLLLYEKRQRLVIDECEPGDRTILFRVGVEEIK